ncbi:MAG TPA: gas vesicle protein GvpG [Gaiellaceae bacterium]
MGLFTGLLLLPLAPLRGTIWLAGQLAEIADQELNDESTVVRLLLEAEMALEAGQISLAEYEEIEDDLLARLELLRAADVEAMS